MSRHGREGTGSAAGYFQGERVAVAAVDRAALRLIYAFLMVDLLLIGAFLALFLSGHAVAVLAIGLERSIPNWYSAAKLLVLAQMLAFVAWRAPAASWQQVWILAAPALLFLLMSVEEVAALRDRVEHRIVPADHAGGAWALLFGLPFAFILAGLGVAYGRVVKPASPIVTKAVAGATIFLLGAVGVEVLIDEPGDHLTRLLPAALEEGAELVGVTLLIWAAFDLALPYLRAILPGSAARSA